MKKMSLIFLLFILLFLPGFTEDTANYHVNFHLTSHVFYPGDKIPVTLNIYYAGVTGKDDFKETVNFKIYKMPQELTSDRYKEYASQNKPLKEINMTVPMETSVHYSWSTCVDKEFPGLPPGNYYIVCSTPVASSAQSIKVTNLGLSAKVSKERLILFLQNRKNGKSIEGVSINMYLPDEVKSFKTDRDGIVDIYIQNLKTLKPDEKFRTVAVCGDDVAEVNISVPAEKEVLKGYVYTDRPVYRPDQKVSFKGILRIQNGDTLTYVSDEDINVVIKDTHSVEVYKNTVKTDFYGTIGGDFTIGDEPPLGTYTIICTNKNGEEASGTFQVQEYRKPEFEITIKPEKEHYVQGDKMIFNMDAKYYFGTPVPDKSFTYQIYREYYYPYYRSYWWEEDIMSDYSSYRAEPVRTGTGKTDKNGMASFTCEAVKADYDATYNLVVTMTDESRREVTGSVNTLVTKAAFYLKMTPDKYFYEPQEKAHVKIDAHDYSGKPVETPVRLKIKYEAFNKWLHKWEWQTVEDVKLHTDANGTVYYDFITGPDGYYTLEYSSEDQNKNPVKGTNYIYSYSGSTYYNWYRLTDLEIIPDKDFYNTGDTASFFIVCPFEGVKALVTLEGEKVFNQKVIDFANRTASFKVNISDNYSPNFYVTVSFFSNGRSYYQTKKIICPSKDKFLTVSIEPDKDKYRPGDNAKFILKTTDNNNRPVTGQVTMGLADESVYAVISEDTPDIQKFFYGFKDNNTITYSSDGAVYGRKHEYSLFAEDGGYDEYNGHTVFYDTESYSDTLSASGSSDYVSTDRMYNGGFSDSLFVKPQFTRSYFPDTAYFNPCIITDRNGMAEVILSMPDTLTTWRATARVVTADTKVGENTKKVIVSKDLLARLITPRFFTEKDDTVITGVLHNYLNSEKTVLAKLETDRGIIVSDSKAYKLKIPPNGEASVDWHVKVKRAGDCKIKLTALTDEESDAVEMTVPVLPHGIEQFVALAGTTGSRIEEEFTLPQEAEKGTSTCVITLEPSVASSVFSSLEYLIGYPYGCVEQTMSRFLPGVIVAKTMEELHIENPDINQKLPGMVKKGFDRLYGFHHSDGGWGWWEHDESHPSMTAYVVYGLTLAKEAGYQVDEYKLGAGINWLKRHYEAEKDMTIKAYMAFSVTTAGENCKTWLLELYGKRQELDSYSLALIAIALEKSGLHGEASDIAGLLEKRATTSVTTACWTVGNESRGWSANSVETTSYCLSALLSVKPESELIPKAVRYLSINRNGNYWYSTKDTATAIMALTGYIKLTKEMDPDFKGDLYFNGTKIDSYRFTKDDVGKPGKKIEIPFDKGLLAGKNKVKFEMRGRGVLYYTIYVKYYTSEEHLQAKDSGFKVNRTCYLIKKGDKEENKKRIEPGKNGEIEVNCQDRILVELEVAGTGRYEYLIIEDPKPAGCEYDSLEVKENYSRWNYWYSHMELRDEKCAYFTTSFCPGTQKISYKLRAETPGTFHVMPARACLMYNADTGGNSDELIVKIWDSKKELRRPSPVKEEKIKTPVPAAVQSGRGGEMKEDSSETGIVFTLAGISALIVTGALILLKV